MGEMGEKEQQRCGKTPKLCTHVMRQALPGQRWVRGSLRHRRAAGRPHGGNLGGDDRAGLRALPQPVLPGRPGTARPGEGGTGALSRRVSRAGVVVDSGWGWVGGARRVPGLRTNELSPRSRGGDDLVPSLEGTWTTLVGNEQTLASVVSLFVRSQRFGKTLLGRISPGASTSWVMRSRLRGWTSLCRR